MSMKFRDKDGNETLIAGMGRSGELVPSVSYYQSGTASFSDLTTQATETITVTLDTAMPDSDYVVVLNVANGVGYVVTSKSESALTVRLQNLRTSTVSAGSFTWQAFKLMTDESRALDEAQIEENTSAIAALQKVSTGLLTLSTGTVSGSVSYRKVGRNISIQMNNMIVQNTGSSIATIQITEANTSLLPANITAYGLIARPAGEQYPLLVQLQNSFLRIYGVPSGGISGWYGFVNVIV